MARDDGSIWIKWLIALAIVALLAGAGFWHWKGPRDDDPQFRTAVVTNGDLVQLVTATGQLNPMTNVLVGSQVSGNIKRLYVDFNSIVTNGEVIAQLDPANYNAQVAQMRGDLANAKAALELAQAEEERSQALYESKIVAKSDYDTAVAALHQAQAQVMVKEAALQQGEVNLAYTTIYAPVDGMVISRNVDVGQTVSASLSAPTLYVIANDLAKMQIDALVSEADIGGIETNQHVSFTVDAYPLRTFQGTVLQIRNSPQTNQNVITYDTVIKVDNSDLKLRPGMTANVSITTAERDDVLRIPNSALRFHMADTSTNNSSASGASGGRTNAGPGARVGGGGEGGGRRSEAGGGGGGRPGSGGHARGERSTRTVYVLETDATGKQTAKPTQIKIGISDAINTEVLSGLKAGDQVIIGQSSSSSDTAQAPSSNPFGGMRRF
jgi:HlyD family secretion protein